MRRLVAPVPGARIDTESVFDAARAVSSAAETHASTGADASVSWLRVGDGYSAPESQQLMSAMTPVRMATEGFAGAAQAVARALTTFALEAEAAQAKQVRATSAISSFRAVATGSDSWQDDPALVAQNTRLTAEAAAAERELCEAEEACARAIAAIPVDAPAPVSTAGTLGAGAPLGGNGTWGYPDGVVEVAINPLFFLGKTPEDVTAWWNGLSAEAQAAFVASFPAIVGNRDGIPAKVRDEANRARLSSLRTQLEGDEDRLTEIMSSTPETRDTFSLYGGHLLRLQNPEWSEAFSELARVRENLAAIDALTQVVDSDAPPRFLLVADLSGRVPRAAVAVGNPDEATHLGVLVPGTSTTVATKMSELDSEAADIYAKAREQSRVPGDSISVVAWLDYEAPPELINATSRSYAQKGSPDLATFSAGLGATNTVGEPRITLMGHSYGAVVAGDAAAETAAGVDSLVVYGAPGAGSNIADGVDKFAMLAPDDPILRYHASLGNLGALGEVPYPQWVTTSMIDPVSGYLDMADGWEQLPVTGSPSSGESWSEESSGHSQYLKNQSRSQFNLVQVLLGNEPSR